MSIIGCRPLLNSEIEIITKKLVNIRDKTLFVFNLKTGFRIQESLSLKVKDVYKNSKVLDRITVQRSNMKGQKSSRTILLHPSAKALIAQLITETGLTDEMYLFQSQKGLNRALGTNRAIGRVQAWKILKQALKNTGLEGKIALHSTRKTFADKMYNALGKNLFKTAKALGHKNPMSTISYLSFRTEEIDEAILTMNNGE